MLRKTLRREGDSTANMFAVAVLLGFYVTVTHAVPDPPYNVLATATDAAASMSWSANTLTFNTKYTVTASPGGKVVTVTGSPAATSASFSGLLNDVVYTFTVVATDFTGNGNSSLPSNKVIARKNVAWTGGSGSYDNPALWNPPYVPYANNTISCSGGAILLFRAVSVLDAAINCQIQSPLGYGMFVGRSLHLQGSASFTGTAQINITNWSLDPIFEPTKLILDSNGNGASSWAICHLGSGLFYGNGYQHLAPLYNLGSLAVSETSVIGGTLVNTGHFTVLPTFGITISGANTVLGGTIAIQTGSSMWLNANPLTFSARTLILNKTSSLTFSNSVNTIGSTQLIADGTATITMDNDANVHWTQPGTWQIGNFRITNADFNNLFTAVSGFILRISNSINFYTPYCGCCGGGPCGKGGGSFTGPGVIELVGNVNLVLPNNQFGGDFEWTLINFGVTTVTGGGGFSSGNLGFFINSPTGTLIFAANGNAYGVAFINNGHLVVNPGKSWLIAGPNSNVNGSTHILSGGSITLNANPVMLSGFVNMTGTAQMWFTNVVNMATPSFVMQAAAELVMNNDVNLHFTQAVTITVSSFAIVNADFGNLFTAVSGVVMRITNSINFYTPYCGCCGGGPCGKGGGSFTGPGVIELVGNVNLVLPNNQFGGDFEWTLLNLGATTVTGGGGFTSPNVGFFINAPTGTLIFAANGNAYGVAFINNGHLVVNPGKSWLIAGPNSNVNGSTLILSGGSITLNANPVMLSGFVNMTGTAQMWFTNVVNMATPSFVMQPAAELVMNNDVNLHFTQAVTITVSSFAIVNADFGNLFTAVSGVVIKITNSINFYTPYCGCCGGGPCGKGGGSFTGPGVIELVGNVNLVLPNNQFGGDFEWTLINVGVTTVTGGGGFTSPNVGFFINAPSGTLTFAANGNAYGVAFINNGHLVVNPGKSWLIAGPNSNVNGSTLILSGGSITLNANPVMLSGFVNMTGTAQMWFTNVVNMATPSFVMQPAAELVMNNDVNLHFTQAVTITVSSFAIVNADFGNLFTAVSGVVIKITNSINFYTPYCGCCGGGPCGKGGGSFTGPGVIELVGNVNLVLPNNQFGGDFEWTLLNLGVTTVTGGAGFTSPNAGFFVNAPSGTLIFAANGNAYGVAFINNGHLVVNPGKSWLIAGPNSNVNGSTLILSGGSVTLNANPVMLSGFVNMTGTAQMWFTNVVNVAKPHFVMQPATELVMNNNVNMHFTASVVLTVSNFLVVNADQGNVFTAVRGVVVRITNGINMFSPYCGCCGGGPCGFGGGVFSGPGAMHFVGSAVNVVAGNTQFGGFFGWTVVNLGVTSVTGGTFASSTTGSFYNNGSLTLSSGAIDVPFYSIGSLTVSPSSSFSIPSGSCAKIMAGSLVLDPKSTLSTGCLVIENAILQGTGTVSGAVSVLNGGVVQPTAAATITFSSTLTVSTGGTLVFTNNGTTSSAYSSLKVSGATTLDGGVQIAGSFAVQLGDEFLAITAPSFSVRLAELVGQAVSMRFTTIQLSNNPVQLWIERIADLEITSYVLVSPTGLDIDPCGDVLRPCYTIQHALLHAPIGVGVLLLPGVYSGTGNYDLVGPPLNPNTVITANARNSSAAVIDCGGNGVGITLFSNNSLGQLAISNITFKNCLHAVVLKHGVASISNCVFNSNSGNIGSSIFSEGTSALTVSHSQFINNVCAGSGGRGAIYTQDSASVTVVGSSFNKNTCPFGQGSAISHASAGALSISSCSFLANTDSAVSLENSPSVTLLASSFVSNVASTGGGVTMSKSAATFTNIAFTSNTAQSGGALAMTGSTLTLSQCKATSNFAQVIGGFAVLQGGNTVIDSHPVYTTNTVVGSGGGVLALTAHDSVAITAGTFTGNKGSLNANGGCFLLQSGGSVSVTSATFVHNTVDTFLSLGGGVVALTGGGGAASFASCTFNTNSAASGGVAFAQGVGNSVTFRSSRLQQNSAQTGGLVALSAGASAQFFGSTMTENTVTGSGGSCYVNSGSNLTIASNSVCSSNSAASGGCVFAEEASFVSVSGIFSSNSANSGGALYLKGPLSLGATQVTSNQASQYGGGLVFDWPSPQTVAIPGVVQVRDNTAYADGGGVYFAAVCPGSPPAFQMSNNTVYAHGQVFSNDVSSAPTSVSYVGSPVLAYEPGIPLAVPYLVVDCFHRQLLELDSTIPFFLNAPAGDSCLIASGSPPSVVSSPVSGVLTFSITMRQPAANQPGRLCNLTMTSSLSGLKLPGSVSFTAIPCSAGVYLNGQTCLPCPYNSYNFQSNAPSCTACPGNARCPNATTVVSTDNFWVGPSAPGQFDAYQCLPNYCQANNLCGPNRKPAAVNPLCGQCEVDYSEIFGKCVYCPNPNGGLAFALILLLFVAVRLYHWLVNRSQESSALVACAIYFCQVYVLLLDPFQPIVLPEISALFMGGGASGSSTGFFSSFCLGPIDFHGQSLLKFFLPIFMLVALFVTMLIEGAVYHAMGDRKEIKLDNWLRTAVVICLSGHSSWLQVGIQNLPFPTSCLSAGPSGSFLEAGPGIPCTFDGWAGFFLLVFLMAWLLFFGVAYFLLQDSTKAKIRDPITHASFARIFGPLFENYDDSRSWWEIVVIGRRSLLVIWYTALFRSDVARVAMLSVTNLAIFCMHGWFLPYKANQLSNQFEFFSLFALFWLVDASNYEQWVVTLGILFGLFLAVVLVAVDFCRKHRLCGLSPDSPKHSAASTPPDTLKRHVTQAIRNVWGRCHGSVQDGENTEQPGSPGGIGSPTDTSAEGIALDTVSPRVTSPSALPASVTVV